VDNPVTLIGTLRLKLSNVARIPNVGAVIKRSAERMAASAARKAQRAERAVANTAHAAANKVAEGAQQVKSAATGAATSVEQSIAHVLESGAHKIDKLDTAATNAAPFMFKAEVRVRGGSHKCRGRAHDGAPSFIQAIKKYGHLPVEKLFLVRGPPIAALA
jgi:hypothetical protein